MSTPFTPWPWLQRSERARRPPLDDKEKVRELLSAENLARIEKLLPDDARLVAYVHALAKKAGTP